MSYLNKLANMTWSHSRVQKFFQCPASFRMRYLDEVPAGPNGIEAFVGSSVHTAVERLIGRRLMGERVSLPELQVFYADAFNAGYNPDSVRIVRDGKEVQEYFDLGTQSLFSFYLRFYPFEQITSSEKYLRFKVGPYRFHGYLDWTDDKGGIWDLKTGGHMLTKEGAQYDLQLSLYEIGLRQSGVDGLMTQNWYYSRFDKVLTVKKTADELARVEERAVKMVEEIEESVEIGHLPYRPNNFCPWCEYVDVCPAQKKEI